MKPFIIALSIVASVMYAGSVRTALQSAPHASDSDSACAADADSDVDKKLAAIMVLPTDPKPGVEVSQELADQYQGLWTDRLKIAYKHGLLTDEEYSRGVMDAGIAAVALRVRSLAHEQVLKSVNSPTEP